MKYKKSIIFIFLLVCFLSIAGVCASDTGDVNIQTGNDTIGDVVALDVDSQENVDAVASQEEIGQDTVAANDVNDELGDGTRSFKTLLEEIATTESGGILNLTCDYSVVGGYTIDIRKNITINGNGHTLNGENLCSFFNIDKDGLNITFKDIIFINGGKIEDVCIEERGGAILNPHFHTNITIINCEFRHNNACVSGGAIYTNGDLTVLDSKFYRNVAESANGGAIFCRGNMIINNTEFEGNEVQVDGFLDRMARLLWNKYFWDGEHNKNRDPPALEDAEKLIQDYRNLQYIVRLFNSGKISDDEAKHRLHELTPYDLYADSFKDSYPHVLIEFETRIKNAQYHTNLPMSGGAIFCQGECIVNNSVFKINTVGTDNEQISTCGGAIHCQSNIYVHNSTFLENSVNDWGGGAIFCEKNCNIYDSTFEDNTANKGCAIYCWKESNVYNSKFLYNHHIEDSTWLENQDPVKKLIDILLDDIPVLGPAVAKMDLGTKLFFPSEGGAIWSGGKCLIDSCLFDNNRIMEHGGAIYAQSDLTITGQGNLFHHNQASRTSFGGFYKDGGAIYCCGNLFMNNTVLTLNTATTDGGAIYCDNTCNVYNSIFELNKATWTQLFKLESCWGGAINTGKLGKVNNCSFKSNLAGSLAVHNPSYKGLYAKAGGVYVRDECSPEFVSCYFEGNGADYAGGAIYIASDHSKLKVTSCNFSSNYVILYGGAIYSCADSTIYGSSFDGNYVTKGLDDKNGMGGAIYSYEKHLTIDHSNFTGNHAVDDGGAIYSWEITVKNCVFTKNKGHNGGAICLYEKSHILFDISQSTFEYNSAKSGGALYLNIVEKIDNCKFIGNEAIDGDGGAIHVRSCFYMDNVVFEDNSANNGGGVYALETVSSRACIFNRNSAKSGGAIYSHTISDVYGVKDSVFTNNHATHGNGGAIYNLNKPPGQSNLNVEFLSCRFEGNTATNCGGALYLCAPARLYKIHTEVSYCTFVDNHANQEDYPQSKSRAYRTPGHSICLEGGTYNLYNFWLGTNDIDYENSHKGQFGELISVFADNYLKPSYFKIGLKLNETDIYEGNAYKAIIYLDKDRQHNLLHSDGKFWGDANFSNFVLGDRNEITADVIFTRGTHTINGQLDHQTVSLGVNVKVKEPSEVHILSCDDIKYPNQLNVTYEILNMADHASFVIKDSKGVIVKQGNLTGQNALLVDGLKPGSYSITINNPESRRYLASSANATFNVLKGDLNLMIVVFNETYPDEVEAIVHAGEDGKYVLSVDGRTWDVIVKNNVSHFNMGVLDAGNYTATISFAGDDLYSPFSNTTTFTVAREGTSFELEVVPAEISYGESAKVIPIFGDGVNGTVVYHLHNGTFIAELPACENLTLPVLDAGSYVIIANYSGDRDHEPAFDSTHITVNKVHPVFKLEADPIDYGDNATVSHILPSAATGTIKYYWENDTFIAELPVGENLTLPVLDVGSYVILANYSGDRNHEPAFDSTHITVNKVHPAFKLEANPIYYEDNATVSHILPGVPSGTIKYYWENGTFIGELPACENLTLPVLDAGLYVIIAKYSGDKNIFNATANATLVINKLKTGIIAFPVITTYKDDDYLLIELKDINGNPVVGVNVTVDLNGTENYTTDENGQIKIFTSNLGANTYDVYVIFNGTSNYLNSSAFTNVFVNTRPSVMVTTSLVTTYQIHKYLMVNLKDDMGRPISDVEVFTVIHGVSYKARTDSNGDGRLIIRLAPMDYVATIVFDNDNYTISMEPARVVVYKADPKIIAKNKKFKATKKVKKYAITLKDNIGKAIKNVKVTLKVKGKTYVAKTNSKGKATFKIKKLTKKGKFKATLTFDGNYLFNKVTKKVKIVCSK